ncbi:autophagy protein Atg13 [Metarhizium album ARSEF 1941]|uniref:Autophagy-related protein 13 n=1 Tax=Metarhizium album (strain ARSEF 1941) TaxID=1081103 RepID=A0A0B2X5N0_METAS|nr:autophagy protein Atg13 [Metarhizium album ARSEF 1941]KHO01689.1 autophagy protein Atg13 [Metarhizium album ARSEF 1941]
MHQQARPPPRLSVSPASSPQINQTSQTRPNTARDAAQSTRQRAGSNVSGRDPTASPTVENNPALGPPADSVKKLDQIVQNFFNKAAVLILESRMKVQPIRNASGQRKTNKWFQIETDEIDDFRDELKTWKTCGSIDHRPPPLIIETFLDTSSLKESQSLVILDDDGKRWDVMEQLNSSESSSSGSYHTASTSRNAEVVLERWHIDLKTTQTLLAEDFGPILPTIYKKAIVFFRSLFITTKLLPAWKFASQSSAKASHPALTPRCRIRASEPGKLATDLLKHPIDGRRDPVTEYVFGDLEVPVGRFSTAVVYRNYCGFRIDDSESLLSSRFMGADENLFKPSVTQRTDRTHGRVAEVGSLHDHRRRTLSDLHQTYGSLSTFHGDGPLGTSPLSALRSVKAPGSDTSSPPTSLPADIGSEVAPSSMPISGRTSIPRAVASRPGESSSRRTSISFQPFKAGSLSGSPVPRQLEPESPSSTHSHSRPVNFPTSSQPRNRSSLTAGMPASLRGGPPSSSVETPMAGPPRPASTGRYSSSFTHRRGRMSTGRAGDDEQNSSGRQSPASSVAQPGSGLLAETGGASSGSLHAEEDAISDFLKALDSRKILKSFEPTKRGEFAANKTVAQLSKFHLMRDSNNALTESMTSSMQMQRSSSSSSRQLTSVPGMVAPASMSVSSSPGKPVSPHTPHTPAIPSRLSENSIIDYTATGRITSRGGRRRQASAVPEPSRESTITQQGTTAIDIPLSPRIVSYQRRSSSAAQQTRAAIEDDETDLAFAGAHRSISLGAGDREPPTMSVLLGRQLQMENEATGGGGITSGLRTATRIRPSDASTSDVMQRGSNEDNLPDGLMPSSVQSESPFPRRRYAGMGAASKATPAPQSSRGSFAGSLSRLARADDEVVGEEPLVFDLSEMDAQGRRSLEEGRGVGNASNERSAFEPRGTTRRGW